MDLDLSAASAHHRSRDDAAMPNGRRSHRDPPRHPTQHDLGMTTTRRSISPAAASVTRSSDIPRERGRDRERERERERDQARNHHHHHDPNDHGDHDDDHRNQRRRPRDRSGEPSHAGPEHRRHSRHRSPDHSHRPSNSTRRPSSSRRDRSRNRPRGRDPVHSPSRRHPGPASLHPRGDVYANADRSPPRGASRSPAPGKRPRSPSPSSAGLQPKKSRRGRSPKGPDRSATNPIHPPEERRGPPDSRRPHSPEYHDRRSKPKGRSGPSRSASPRRRRSRSPGGNPLSRPPQDPAYLERSNSSRHRKRSPLPDHRRSRSGRRTPPQWGGRPPNSSDTGSRRRQSPDPGSRAPVGPPPGSPGGRRRSKSGKKRRGRDEPRSLAFDPSSGANSIDVNMGARGGFRGGFNPQLQQPGYPGKGQYNQGPHDTRGYAQSSGHGTPNSSYHGTPPAQSPYGGSGRGWNGQQQFSPQSQYPPPYPHGNYGPPTGPQGHYHPNQAHSPPYPPNGPSSQYSSASYRGAHRGGPGGFRGGQFGPGRGGHRGNFKNSQWNANPRSQPGSGEEAEGSHNSSHSSPNNHSGAQQDTEDVQMEDGDNPFRPSKDLQVEDSSKSEQAKEEEMPPPNRPPPTGPQSQTPNKFSFSMKNASKPVVAAPRPEISSKFNATPASREPPPKAPQKPAPKPERERGAFPKNVPTEPASARARPNDRRPAEPSRPPEPTPKTRKVKKVMKRLKEKPVLPQDLAKSRSVFFRKPGNESVVGSGTYGKVFKGLNVYTKKLVALKRIRMEGERDGFPVTAVREIKLLRSLSHKNIVQLQEVMVETNECFMVFEYLSHDLTGLLNHPNYTLDASQKKHLAQQLFQGLDYLHTRGVLHRDIKAANILVSNEGILKLADFGLARFYAKHHQLDYTNRVITIWYRSPELLLGETQYGPAVDIWSAACVMMEIFTKRAIFPGDGTEISQLEKIHSVLGTPNRTDWPNVIEMPWFELLRPTYKRQNVFAEKYKEHLTAAAFDLLAAMFQYDPSKRPTAAEVLEHPYFATEQPSPRQAIELKDVDGEWHEFESKALRRENERKEKELRRAAQKEATTTAASARDKDRKRPNESSDVQRESKRPHVDGDGKAKTAGPIPQAAKSGSHETQQRQPQTSQIPVGGHTKPDQVSVPVPALSGSAAVAPPSSRTSDKA